MKLTIHPNIPDSLINRRVVDFARYFTQCDFINIRKMLVEDAFIVLYNKEQIDGADAVIEYFKDWLSRVGEIFECEVKWCGQFHQAGIYFNSEKYQQAYILFVNESKISRILLTPRSFTQVGFSIDENPYNVGFIKANAPKEFTPLVNHYFCPICGRKSEDLNWSEGVIFKEGPGWRKQTGLIVNASVCPECNVVCEVSPDRNVKRVLSMTREQQQKADARMTPEELSHYVGNTMGNKKPLFVTPLNSRTNELAQIGKSFHALLKKVVKNKQVNKVIDFLDKLTFKSSLPFENIEVKLHVVSNDTDSIGDESYFYIGKDEKGGGGRLYKLLTAEPSVHAAWQIYLLFTSHTVMPVFWHGGYIVRNFIFDEAAINDIETGFYGEKPLECFDLKGLSRADLLLPEVVLSPDGRYADVYCTYWNDWAGLVRDHLQILFQKNGKVELTQSESLVLFKYDCGILF